VTDISVTHENEAGIIENQPNFDPKKTLKIGAKVVWKSQNAIVAHRSRESGKFSLWDGAKLTTWIAPNDLIVEAPPTLEAIAQVIDHLHHLDRTWQELTRSFAPETIDQAIATLPPGRRYLIAQSRDRFAQPTK
jgi:hypothetical protein